MLAESKRASKKAGTQGKTTTTVEKEEEMKGKERIERAETHHNGKEMHRRHGQLTFYTRSSSRERYPRA